MNNTVEQHIADTSIFNHVDDQVDRNIVSLSGNTYYALDDEVFKKGKNTFPFSEWVTQSGELGSNFTPSSFPDPDRNLESYDAMIGGAGTLEAFLREARLQQKGNWRFNYTAAPVNSYIREGFGIGQD